jgi:hypothetical protein
MTYTFVIKSTDKISGLNNDGVYSLNFRILPRDVKYFRVSFSFYTKPSFYQDVITSNLLVYSCANGFITVNLRTPLSVENSGSPTSILGFWTKQTLPTGHNTHSYINYLYSGIDNNSVPLTVLRPEVEQISIRILAMLDDLPVVDTDHAGAFEGDMTDWILTMNFEPVLNVDKE